MRQFTVGGGLKSIFVDERRRPLLKAEVQWEVEASLRLSAHDIHAAAETRTAWYETILALFRVYDFLLLPTAQVFPFAADLHWPGEIDGRPMDSYHRWMEVVVAATMAGCPAISVPVGFDRERGPMGLQIIGPPRADLAVLQIAHAYELVCPWCGTAP